MKFEDYLKNPELAVATEIYNAKCNSPEEMMELLAATQNQAEEFDKEISEFLMLSFLNSTYDAEP
jgi:hypothetical protein